MTNNQIPKYEPPTYEIKWYVLRYRKPVISDVRSADQLLGNYRQRRVRRTYFNDELFVSTIFLCLDHNLNGGTPLLFETAINRNGEFDVISRCSTWREALAMHWTAVEQVKETCQN